MSKQAERKYALRVRKPSLFRKPYDKPREFREFALVLQIFREHFSAAKRKGRRVLDLGCGPGWTSLFLDHAGYDVVGVDISERMIEVASARCTRENAAAEFIVGDMEKLSLDRQNFDAVLCFDCLHHCPKYRKVLQRAHAHLKPGGIILLMETTWLHRWSPHARAATAKYGVTELGFSKRQLRNALREAGFQDITFHHDPGPCYSGISGFLKAAFRLACDYLVCYPQAKNAVSARKA